MVNVLYLVTMGCNYKCRHCCYSAGPDQYKKTTSKEDAEKILNHLPAEMKNLSLSGGEVTTVPVFKDILSYINKHNVLNENTSLSVHTNGVLFKNKELAYDFLSEMYDYGVTKIYLNGYTRYHEEQGTATLQLDWDFEAAMKKLAKNVGKEEPLELVRDLRNEKGFPVTPGPLPFGRAKNLPRRKIRREFKCYLVENYKKKEKISDSTIDYDGQAYLCCFGMFPMGSALETHMDEMLTNADKDPVIGGTLFRKGFESLAKKFGTEVKDPNHCTVCEDINKKIYNGTDLSPGIN